MNNIHWILSLITILSKWIPCQALILLIVSIIELWFNFSETVILVNLYTEASCSAIELKQGGNNYRTIFLQLFFFTNKCLDFYGALVVFCIKLPDGGGDTKLSALSLFHFHHVHCHQRYNCCHRQCLLVMQKKHIHAKLLNTTIALKIRKWQNDKHVSQPRRNTRIFNRTLDTSLFNQTQHHCVSYQSNISPFCQKYFCDCQDDDGDDDGDDHGVIDDGVDRDGGGPPLVGVNWK